MNKLITALCLTILTGICASAQTVNDYNKNEFFVGYSNQQVDRGQRDNFNGVEVSYVRNVSRYVGIKGDFSGAYQSDEFVLTTTNGIPGNTTTTTSRTEVKNSLYNFLGGVQVKDNASEARLKPFGHALAGVALNRNKLETPGTSGGLFNDSFNDTGFSAAVGGGLDIKINDRFDFRAIQADYNPIRVNGRWSNNFRFGIGLVIK